MPATQTIPGAPHVGTAAQGSDDATFANLTFSGKLLSAGQTTAVITANKTLAEGDSGTVQLCGVDGVIFTLPATVVGMSFTIMNTGAPGAAAIAFAPNSSDKIMGNGYTSADNKAVTNTKATAVTGDYMRLMGDGANGWFIVEARGIWAKTA